jgi:hypothetical protein
MAVTELFYQEYVYRTANTGGKVRNTTNKNKKNKNRKNTMTTKKIQAYANGRPKAQRKLTLPNKKPQQ